MGDRGQHLKENEDLMKPWDRLHLSLTLLSFWATLSVALTGEIAPQQIIPVLALLPLGYVLRSLWRKLPSWVWDVIVVAIMLALFPVARRSLLTASVLFFLSLQVVKCYSFRRLSDAYSIYLISFFEVLAAAILTTSPVFGVAFMVYVFLLVRSILLHMSLSCAIRAELSLRRLQSPKVSQRSVLTAELLSSPRVRMSQQATLSLPAAILTLVLLALSAAFFPLIPRLSARRVLQSLPPSTTPPASAFDENIEFGKSGRIQLDQSVAMYVKPLDEGMKLSSIRMRAVALDTFDGSRWVRTSGALYREPFGPFNLRPYSLSRFLVVQQPNISRFLFGPTFPHTLASFELQTALLSDPAAGAAFMIYPAQKEIHYTIVSRLETLEEREDPEHYRRPTRPPILEIPREQQSQQQTSATILADSLRSVARQFGIEWPAGRGSRASASFHSPERGTVRGVMPRYVSGDFIIPEYRERCLALPPTIDRAALERLAREVTHNATSIFAKALAIEKYLRTNYQYSLDIPESAGASVVEDFLFRTRRGHCEYFATAMALLLRAIDIPSRVVNGYYSTEWNNIAGMFTVRQRDAHSWVEAYFDGYGWMTFDPTPPDALARTVEMNPLLLAFTRYYDALKLRWYRAVIDFSIQDQQLVARGVFRLFFSAGDLLGSFTESGGQWRASEEWAYGTELLVLIASLGTGVVVLVILLRRFSKKKKTSRFARHLTVKTRPIPRFYADLLEALKSLGYIRKVAETPMEFAQRVSSQEGLRGFDNITAWYYAYRFGGQDLPHDAQSAIEEFRQRLRAFRNHKARVLDANRPH